MTIVAAIFFLIAGAGVAIALWTYTCNTRARNADLMGACIVFNQYWLLSAIPLSIAVAMLPGLAWWWGLVAFAAMYLFSTPIKLVWGRMLTLFRPNDA